MESYIPTLSPETAEDTLNEIQATQRGVATRTTTWGNFFNGLDDGQKEYIPKLIEETEDLTQLTGNDLVQANKNAQKAVLDHNQAVKQHSLSAKAGQFATQAFSMALNMAAFAAISFGIQLIATGIENFVHRVERSNEAMRQASSDYKSAKERLADINKELETNGQRMDELKAKGTLSVMDQEELERLQAATRELLIQQDIEERKTKQAGQETNEKTLEAYDTQYGNMEISKEEVKDKLDFSERNNTAPQPLNENDVAGQIASYVWAQKGLEEDQKSFDEAKRRGEDTSLLAEDIQDDIDEVDRISGILDERLADMQEKRMNLDEGYQKALEHKKAGLMSTSDMDTISAVEELDQAIYLLYEYTDQEAWNQMEVSDILNTKGLEKTKEELIELFQTGELTPDSLKNFTNLNQAIEDSSLFFDDGSDKAHAFYEEIARCAEEAGKLQEHMPVSSYKSSLDQVQELASKLAKLQNIYQDIQDGGLNWSSVLGNQDFDEIFQSAGTAYDEFIKTVTQNPDDIEACQAAFDNLVTAMLENDDALNHLTDDNKDVAIAILTQSGVSNAAELVNARTSDKPDPPVNDAPSPKPEQTAPEKETPTADETLAENADQAAESLTAEGEAAKSAAQDINDLALVKMDMGCQDLNLWDNIQQITSLGNAASTSTSQIADMKNAMVSLPSTAFGAVSGKAGSGSLVKAVLNKKKQEAQAANAQKPGGASSNKAQFSSPPKTNSSPSGSSRGGGGGSRSAAPKVTVQTFNFIETAISRIESSFDRLKTKASETFRSFTSRTREYDKALAKLSEEETTLQQANNSYLARANSVGLEEAWAAQVRNGSINLADVTDDGLKERIKNYQDWYEKALKCQEKLEDLKKTQRELAQEKIELQVSKYEKILSNLESASDIAQNKISFKELWGFSPTQKSYDTLNKNLRQQISNTVLQTGKLKELQTSVKKNSEAWREYQKRIDANYQSLQKLTKSMAENSIASAALAGQSAKKKNEKKDRQDERLNLVISSATAASEKNSKIGIKIGNIDSRQENLKTAYQSARKNRQKYGNKIRKATKKHVSKNHHKLFKDAIEKVKSNKRIPENIITKIINTLNKTTGKEHQELRTLLSYCNDYNANKNAEEENRLNLEMYALTAQADKRKLREEQLQNTLEGHQKRADRNTISNEETTAGKNHNLDVQMRLNNANVSAQTSAWKSAVQDRKTAAGKAKFYTSKTYRKLKNTKLKNRLKKAVDAIKSGKKIDRDSLKAVKEYCQKYLNNDLTYYYNCEAYNEAVENELSAKEAETFTKAEAYAENLKAKREKAENTVSGRNTENDLYAATAKNQTSAQAKNQYTDKQIANINKNRQTYHQAYQDSLKDFNNAKSVVHKSSTKDKGKQKIINEIKSKYTGKNLLIPADYIEKAYTVSEAFGLACENYNEALNHMEAAKETADFYDQTSRTDMAALALEKLDNIEKEYSNKQQAHSQTAEQINHSIDMAQAKGYQAGTRSYEQLIQNETANYNLLSQKRQKMVDSLNESIKNGSITMYSDEWYEATADIDAVTNALNESALSVAEFQKQIQQISWDNFDYLQERIQSVASEMEFLLNELSREELSDDKSGSLTDQGRAAAFLHASGYEIYRHQAESYQKELTALSQELSKDPYRKDLLDRKEALLKSYQDAVKGAQDEKYAVIDLYKQGYEALSHKIQELISDYGELLDAEKDAYDYQNTIADKTKSIADLRKQISAYAGDSSEETRAKLQSLTISLEQAEKDLKETQYNKYISDTKEMLSSLQENLQEVIQELISSLSGNFQELLTEISKNSQSAAETITEAMTGIGYLPGESFSSLLNNSATAGGVNSIQSSVSQIAADITSLCAQMAAYANRTASTQNFTTAGGTVKGSRPSSLPTSWTVPGTAQEVSLSSTPLYTGQLLDSLNLSSAPAAAPMSQTGSTQNLILDIGGISMYEVNDPETFAKNLTNAMNNNTVVRKALLNCTVETLSNSYNSLSGRKFL
ncbi:MAG: hypothetical protein HFH41_00460 [Lachnospiraceae bacterium]|nr:hypothetical protein [Lachnospiraceae bacterium]